MTRFGQTTFTAAAAGLFVLGALAGSARAASPSAGEMDPAKDDRSIRPFQFHAPDEALADLRRRVAATKWPSQELVTDASEGVQLATMRELARHWQSDCDWRKAEARPNALPQFMTKIDGVQIHLNHVRSKHPNAWPLIVTHGWPGSIIEQLKIIDPLTNPTAHGGSASDAFDVVIPSLPGHGFSGKPTTLGWDPIRIARAWTVLMKPLRYTRFVAQGGDWGNAVTEQIALQAPPEPLGIHTNMPATVPAAIEKALWSGGAAPPGLTADEPHAYDQLDFFYKNGLAYAQKMSHRPQTLYGIDVRRSASPPGCSTTTLAVSSSSRASLAAGKRAGRETTSSTTSRSTGWNPGVLSARLYWESKLASLAPKGSAIPVAVSAFPDELYQAPRSWTERAYPKLGYYKKLDRGAHFAALEQPQLFATEMRAAFNRYGSRMHTTERLVAERAVHRGVV